MENNLSTFLQAHPTLSAVSYCRVSSKEQQEGFSLDMQARIIEKFATERGIRIVRRFEEAASASKRNRPEYRNMMRYLEDNDATNPKKPIVVLVEKSDRFGRDVYAFIDFLRGGFRAIETKMGAMISESMSYSETKRMLNDAVDNQGYSQRLSEDVRRGQLGKAHDGYYPFGGRKFGYLPAKDEFGKATMTPDPERAALVGQMFRDFASGDFSVKTIAKKYRELGLVIKSSGRPLTPQQIHKMLRDKSYAGYFICEGKEFKASRYEPLINLELWQQVQGVLDGRSKSKKPTVSKLEFAYSRLFGCKECGCLICGESKKDGRFIYFHCTNGRGKHSVQENISQVRIDDAIGRVIDRISFSPEIIQLMQASYAMRIDGVDKFKAQSIESIERQVAVTKTHLGILLEKLVSNVITDEIYRQKEQELNGRIAGLTLSLKNQKSLSLAEGSKEDRLCQIIQSMASLYPKQTPTAKRRFLKLIINKAEMSRDGLNIEFQAPFDRFIAPTLQVTFEKAS